MITPDSSFPATEPLPVIPAEDSWLGLYHPYRHLRQRYESSFPGLTSWSDSYKPGIRALGLLCSPLISSWSPAYNSAFKARGLETFPVSPAPTGSQSSAWLAKLRPQAVAFLKKKIKTKRKQHRESLAPRKQSSLPLANSLLCWADPLHDTDLEVRDAGLGLRGSKISVDHI